ncbi:hypothetical protein EDD17DRAFT_1634728 [Pisolithus thermaeus]|nr:hypothetical protein EDD17DRAFT_1634728 [Pisolithus thermaeus]
MIFATGSSTRLWLAVPKTVRLLLQHTSALGHFSGAEGFSPKHTSGREGLRSVSARELELAESETANDHSCV